MNKITKFSTLALAAAMAFTGCIKETQPTSTVTADAVAQSATAVEAMVNAIPVAEALPYSVFGSGNNQGFDFGLPGIMCATDAATGDVVGVFMKPTDYAVNSNLKMVTVKWVDHDTNQVKNKCILICDGKLVDANGVLIIKKGAVSA